MNSGQEIGIGAAHNRRWRLAGVTLLATTALAIAALLSGCESTERKAVNAPNEVGESKLALVSTEDLKVRRAEVLKRYVEIQREVDLKAGLPLAVPIRDERALLGDLYREAHEIERELLRRWSRGDPQVTMEQVKASF